MCASPLKLFREGPPPPRVVLLPDALFFARSLPVAPEDGAGAAAAPAAEIGSQIELALEAAAPFPLAQLFYGYYWSAGSDRALAFAAYRRRFTAEQSAEWRGAELVIPTFAAVFGGVAAPATTVLVPSPEGLTAVYWGEGSVPTRVVFQPVAAEATAEEREQIRTEFIRRFETKVLVELPGAPVAEAGHTDGVIDFRAGEWVSRFSAATAAVMDVRDKEELAALQRARRRDVLLWRAGVACVAAFGLLALGELALFGGGLWQETRRVNLNAQAPLVDRITASNEVAHHIQDLRTKRLLPLEMISAMGGQRPSDNIQFLHAETNETNLYTIAVQAQTPNAAEIDVFRDKLKALPSCDNVSVKTNSSRENMTIFTVTMTFKPAALQPESLPPAT